MIQTMTSSKVFGFLDATHSAIQAHLGTMARLVNDLCVSSWDAQQRAQAREVYTFFEHEARQHHLDEEKHVFPPLMANGDADMQATLRRLQQDHGWIEADWGVIGPMLSAAIEDNVGGDEAALKQAVDVFVPLCIEHLLLEESMIYPAAKAAWQTWQQSEAAVEMQRRRDLADERHCRLRADQRKP